jgi:cyclophilin family peptidyl-prolyl cis-trans isomerase
MWPCYHVEAMRPTRLIAALALASLVALAAAGCGTDTQETTVTEPTPQPSQSAPGLHVSTTTVDTVKKAVITTDKGVIEVTFRPDKAPNTVASIVELAESGFYDGTKFHRVEPGFVVQGGDPQTKDPSTNPSMYGTGGPGWNMKAEFNDLKHDRGVIAMARSQAVDSAGSQFYFTLAPANFLDGQYTVFGTVEKGMDVVDKLAVGDTLRSFKIVRGE